MIMRSGTRLTGDMRLKEPSNYLKFAKTISAPQTLASWIWPECLMMRIGIGHLRPSSSLPSIGLQRKRGHMMLRPEHARGFLMLLLTSEQKNWLKATEQTLPLGRYLTNSEIYQQYPNLGKKLISNEQLQVMDQCWKSFCKRNGGTDWVEKREEWGEWVSVYYVEPLPALTSSVSVWND